jgi:hypothetical protein
MLQGLLADMRSQVRLNQIRIGCRGEVMKGQW